MTLFRIICIHFRHLHELRGSVGSGSLSSLRTLWSLSSWFESELYPNVQIVLVYNNKSTFSVAHTQDSYMVNKVLMILIRLTVFIWLYALTCDSYAIVAHSSSSEPGLERVHWPQLTLLYSRHYLDFSSQLSTVNNSDVNSMIDRMMPSSWGIPKHDSTSTPCQWIAASTALR